MTVCHNDRFFAAIATLGPAAWPLASAGTRRPFPEGTWLMGALFFAAPALVFTLHRQTSGVVLAVVVPGVVALGTVAWHRAAGDALPAPCGRLALPRRWHSPPRISSPEGNSDRRMIRVCRRVSAE